MSEVALRKSSRAGPNSVYLVLSLKETDGQWIVYKPGKAASGQTNPSEP